jgi:hypothetical protein
MPLQDLLLVHDHVTELQASVAQPRRVLQDVDRQRRIDVPNHHRQRNGGHHPFTLHAV